MRLIDLGAPRGKFTDVIADPDGWTVAVHDDDTGNVTVRHLTMDGEERSLPRSFVCGGGNAFPRLHRYANETYLAFRQGSDSVGILRNLSRGTVTELGVVHGNDPICFGGWWIAYQASADYRIDVRPLPAPERVTTFDQHGAPTGLSSVDEAGLVTTVDVVRTSQPGMVNPRRAGACVVGESASGIDRDIARLSDGRACDLWPSLISFTPRIAWDGETYAVVTWGLKGSQGGARLALLSDADFTVPAPPIDPFELAPDGTLVEDCFDYVFGKHPSLWPGSARDLGRVCIHKNIGEHEWYSYGPLTIFHMFDASRYPGDTGWYLSEEATPWMRRSFRSGESLSVVGERIEFATGARVPWRHRNTMYALKHGGVMLQFDPRFPSDYGLSKRYERFYWTGTKIRWEEWFTPAAGQPDVMARRVEVDVNPNPVPPPPYVECPRPTETPSQPSEPAMPDLTEVYARINYPTPSDVEETALRRFRENLLERDRVAPDTMSLGALRYFTQHYGPTMARLKAERGIPGSAQGWADMAMVALIAAANAYNRDQKPPEPGQPPPTGDFRGPIGVDGRNFVA